MKSRFSQFRTTGWRLLASLGCASLVAQPAMADAVCLRGINLAGAEFGEVGEVYGKGYIYPSSATIAYFAHKGFTAVRLPFLWERLQPKLYRELDEAEAKRLVATVELMRAKGMTPILDPHNYARYNGNIIGSEETPQSAFADFWRRLAMLFADKNDVLFGLMNEPYEISAENWLSAANSAIAAIRQTGAQNLVLVPGTSWTGAHSWFGGDYGSPNSSVMLGIADPGNNYAFEVHQYLDADFSGKNEECSRAPEALRALSNFSTWLRDNGRRGFLGEFAVPRAETCQAALADMVAAVETDRDIWLGWSYWAAGDWWPVDEPLSIQPLKGRDRPQMQTLSRILSDRASCGR